MFLGIEIGGTKLQLGVGPGDGAPLRALERFDVQPEQGALGILHQIEAAATILISRHQVSAVGFGFGGPVNTSTGSVLKSHQVDGWEGFAPGGLDPSAAGALGPLTQRLVTSPAWQNFSLQAPAAITRSCSM